MPFAFSSQNTFLVVWHPTLPICLQWRRSLIVKHAGFHISWLDKCSNSICGNIFKVWRKERGGVGEVLDRSRWAEIDREGIWNGRERGKLETGFGGKVSICGTVQGQKAFYCIKTFWKVFRTLQANYQNFICQLREWCEEFTTTIPCHFLHN